jgi:hypothetical protein
MNAGEVFHLPDWFGGHFNFVLKVLEDGSIIICNFTERKRYSDTTCVVSVGEHECITKESVAYFEKAYCCPPGDPLAALERQISGRKAPLSPELLARLRQGALASRHTPEYIKDHLRDA